MFIIIIGRARERKEKNAARNKLITQAKEAGKHGTNNKKMHNNLEHPQIGENHHKKGNLNNPDMICTLDSRAEKHNEINDSTGVSISRTSRSCFNSTAGPTGTTTVPASANVSIAQMETTEDESSPKIRVINGNLAPPPPSVAAPRPTTSSSVIMSKSSATSAEK